MLHSPFTRLRKPRAFIAPALALALLAQGVLAHPPIAEASTYNCSGGHCYGVAAWQRGSIMGAQTTLASINYVGGGDGFVTQETWLSESPPPANYFCNVNNVDWSSCWVEAGIMTQGLGGGTCASAPNYKCYFWADVRPSTSNTNNFYVHPVDAVAQNDFGQSATFAIYGSQATQTYTVQTITPHGTFYNTSTGNTMIPTGYQIGVELEGDSLYGSAVIPPSDFIDTYYNPSGEPYWTAETVTGSLMGNGNMGPITDQWVVPPAPGNVGGDFRVWCPGSGNAC